MERKLGYYWVNAFDAWIIAEFTERFEWFACGSEEDISDEIKEIADYIGCDGSTLNEAKAILPINIVSNNEVAVCDVCGWSYEKTAKGTKCMNPLCGR